MDSTSNYRTPPILFAHASGYSIITFNTSVLNDYGTNGNINITKEKLLNMFGLLTGYANAARIRLGMPSGTYYIRKVNPSQIDVTKNTTEVVE